ncbi:MAG TPA: hypothetical protein VJQ43_06280 [Thermoplasmata archaeon]|nr:hypothetical protein [Thermoplasmata archaeon]
MGPYMIVLGPLVALWTPRGGSGPQRFVIGPGTSLLGGIVVAIGVSRYGWTTRPRPDPGTAEYATALRRLKILAVALVTAALVSAVLSFVFRR